MQPVTVPAIEALRGVPCETVYEYIDKAVGAVDLTLWACSIVCKNAGKEVLNRSVPADALGRVTVQFSADDLEKMRGPHVGFELRMIAPRPEFSELLVGAIVVRG